MPSAGHEWSQSGVPPTRRRLAPWRVPPPAPRDAGLASRTAGLRGLQVPAPVPCGVRHRGAGAPARTNTTILSWLTRTCSSNAVVTLRRSSTDRVDHSSAKVETAAAGGTCGLDLSNLFSRRRVSLSGAAGGAAWSRRRRPSAGAERRPCAAGLRSLEDPDTPPPWGRKSPGLLAEARIAPSPT